METSSTISVSFSNWLYLVAFIVSVSASTLGTALWFSWWLSKQFADMKTFVITISENIKQALTAKIEYHEKHDDRRFQSMMDDLWAIKVRNAAKDVKMDDFEKELIKYKELKQKNG